MFDIVEGLSTRFSKKKAVENEAPVPEPAGGVR
jgi:hypothetical protein